MDCNSKNGPYFNSKSPSASFEVSNREVMRSSQFVCHSSFVRTPTKIEESLLNACLNCCRSCQHLFNSSRAQVENSSASVWLSSSLLVWSEKDDRFKMPQNWDRNCPTCFCPFVQLRVHFAHCNGKKVCFLLSYLFTFLFRLSLWSGLL